MRLYSYGQSIIASGDGIPDRDVPSVLEETKFWVMVQELGADVENIESARLQ